MLTQPHASQIYSTRWKLFSTTHWPLATPLLSTVRMGGDRYSERVHVHSGDGIVANSRMEREVRQGDGRPRKARSARLSVFGFNSLAEGRRDQMGVQGQSRAHAEMTSFGSGLGTDTGSRLRLHLRSGMPYSEHPDGTHHCCERGLENTSTRCPDSVSKRKCSIKGIRQDPSWLRVRRRCYPTTSRHERQK